jgi:DNA invertase Pin-like site-specific DNA recombinase
MGVINQLLGEFFALYRRVSSDKQVEKGESLEAQLSLANQYIAKLGNNATLLDYCEEGVSGSKVHFTKRPQLMRMLDDAKKGLFKTLLVFRRDRLDRSDDFHTIKYILIKAGVKIIYLDVNELNVEDDSIYGNLIESVITSIAAIEPKLISTRVKAVLREKSLKGLWKTGTPPFGLYHEKENSKLISIPEEAEIVKKIFHYYVNERMGYRKIALLLNKENVLFRNHLNIKNQWSISNIKSIINNPIYKGFIRLIEEDKSITLIRCAGMKESIISPEMFDKANEIRESRNNLSIKPREITTTFLLSNILYCSCGNSMIGLDNSYYYTRKNGEKTYRKYLYYSCILYLNGKYQGICNVKRINAELVHQIALDKCSEMFQPSNYEKTRIKLIEKQNVAIDETKLKIRHLSRRISDINRKIEVLLENLESSTEAHLVATYESRLSRRTKELEHSQVELINQKRYYNELKAKIWTIEEISEKLKDWRKKIYDVSAETKRKMLLDVLNRVLLNEEGELTIELKLSLDNLELIKEKGAHNNSYVYLFPFIL